MKNIQPNAASAHGSNDRIAGHRIAGHRIAGHRIAGQRAGQVASRQSGQPIQSAPAYGQNHPDAQEISRTISVPVRRDEELALLFQQMRQVAAVDRMALASHLHTTPDVIATFEAGEIDSFPPWAETVRIVTTLTKLVAIDSEPILERIAKHAHEPTEISQFTQPVSQPITQEIVPEAAPASVKKTERKAPKKFDHVIPALKFALPSGRAIAVAAIPFAMAFAFMMAPSFDKQNRISGPLGNYARAGWEMLLWSSNSVRDGLEGLRWIETDDPRSRKADKLKTGGG